MTRAEEVGERLHRLFARRVAAHEDEVAEIVDEMYRAIRDLPPAEVLAALRVASEGMAQALVRSARKGLEEAARRGAQASYEALRVELGPDFVSQPTAVGWEAAARWVEDRGPDGLSLSDRIHRQTAVYRAQLDRVLSTGIREGTATTEQVRRLTDDYFIRSEPVTPRAIRDLESAVRQMGVGGGDGAYAAASRAAVDVRRQIERLVALPRARHGIAPATEHMVDRVLESVWKGQQEAAEKAIRWWAHDKARFQMETVVRTESQRAYARAFEEHAASVPGVVGLIWVTTMDGNACEVCVERNGKKYPLDDHPDCPAHPRCRCRWIHAIDRAALPGEIVRRALAA